MQEDDNRREIMQAIQMVKNNWKPVKLSKFKFKIIVMEELRSQRIAKAYFILEKHMRRWFGHSFTSEPKNRFNKFVRKYYQNDLSEFDGLLEANYDFVISLEEMEKECIKQKLGVFIDWEDLTP